MNKMEETKRKCSYVVDLKTVCFILAYLLLANGPGMVVKRLKYLLYGLVIFAAVVAVIGMTTVLLSGLYLDNQRFIRMYIIYGKIMLLVAPFICIFEKFFMDSEIFGHLARNFAIALNASIFMINWYRTGRSQSTFN
ncbi:uncharacterized protein [Battus philenor]|uniref:uncharacterized protein n=1 Tax=Battus philenor TaxID=42288 RepID=UPI0035D125F3